MFASIWCLSKKLDYQHIQIRGRSFQCAGEKLKCFPKSECSTSSDQQYDPKKRLISYGFSQLWLQHIDTCWDSELELILARIQSL